MKIQLTILIALATTFLQAQEFSSMINLFDKQGIPYSSPESFYTDAYLEEGEESTIPFKVLSNEFYYKIGGDEHCRCENYAVDQVSLGNGFIGLVVYEVATVERIPYEQGSYVLFIVDSKGESVSSIKLSTSFFTSDAYNRSYSDGVDSEIYSSDIEGNQLIIKKTLESSEYINEEFGQTVTRISTNFYKIGKDGKLTDVTVWIEEY